MSTARGLEQRLSALAHANEVRCERARVKRDVRAGRVSLASAMGMECIGSMELIDLVLCVPKVGRVKAANLVRRLGVSPSRRVDGLTVRQRDAILAGCAAANHVVRAA